MSLRIAVGAAAVLALVVGVVVLVSHREVSDSSELSRGQPDLASAKRSLFAFFWLGESFEGLPLTYVGGDRAGTVTTYGTCDPGDEAGTERSCAPPLQVQTRDCDGREVNVAVFDGRGKTARAFRAARAVRPMNQAARKADWGYPSVDFMEWCPRDGR